MFSCVVSNCKVVDKANALRVLRNPTWTECADISEQAGRDPAFRSQSRANTVRKLLARLEQLQHIAGGRINGVLVKALEVQQRRRNFGAPPSPITSSALNHNRGDFDHQHLFLGKDLPHPYQISPIHKKPSTLLSRRRQQSWVTENLTGNASTPYGFWL